MEKINIITIQGFSYREYKRTKASFTFKSAGDYKRLISSIQYNNSLIRLSSTEERYYGTIK